jgi:hypothetical protein
VIQVIIDPNDPRSWRTAAINVPLGAAGGAGEVWMESQLNMRLMQPLLSRAAAPGTTAGTSRLLTSAGFLGRGAAASGAAAVAAPAVTMAAMGIEDLFFGGEYTRIDYAAKGGRSAVAGGAAAAGGWLAAGGIGALAGSEVPILGNAVGFLVGVGLYFLADATIGEDVEAGIREYAGEQGCVGGRMGNTWSSSSRSARSSSLPFSSAPFVCFVGETLIAMEDGSQCRIDTICVGDQVLSYDEDVRAIVSQPVIAAPNASVIDLLGIELEGGVTLYLTAAHELRTLEGWLVAGQVRANQKLMVYDSGSQKLKPRVVIGVSEIARPVTVYDLTVVKTHNYFANGVLAHNKI